MNNVLLPDVDIGSIFASIQSIKSEMFSKQSSSVGMGKAETLFFDFGQWLGVSQYGPFSFFFNSFSFFFFKNHWFTVATLMNTGRWWSTRSVYTQCTQLPRQCFSQLCILCILQKEEVSSFKTKSEYFLAFPAIGYCPLACLFDSYRLLRENEEFYVCQKPMVLFLHDLLCIKPYMNAEIRSCCGVQLFETT